MLAQRIFGLELSYKDLNDHQQRRSDPLLAVLSGKRKLVEPLAGKSTLNRLELTGRSKRYHKISYSAEAIDRLLVDLYTESHAVMPSEVVLDLNATEIPLYGHQPERCFHGYYDSYCYLPLYIFAFDQLLCSHPRRVVAKAEHLDKGENPRFVVTSLGAGHWAAQALYEKFYCARGEMENRIKEQVCLFADRFSPNEMKGNQLRIYFSALAYTLVEALRRLALKGTESTQAQVDTIRLKLFKIGAVVRVSVRRIVLQMSSAYPWKDIYTQAFQALRC